MAMIVLLRATAKRRGGEAARASSLVGHDASSIAPSLAAGPDLDSNHGGANEAGRLGRAGIAASLLSSF
jgi:hypothetical protein